MVNLKTKVIGLCLFGFMSFTWGSCSNDNGCLTINDFIVDVNANSMDPPFPFLSVTNADNTTTVFVKTYDNHQFTLWKMTPEYDSYETAMSFYVSKTGNFLWFNYVSGYNQSNPPPESHTIIVDLKNNLITKPMQDIDAYSAEGLGVFDDPKSPYDLLIRPIFGPCAQPTAIPLDKESIQSGFGAGPTFIDNTHLQIGYYDQGVQMAEGTVTIDPVAIRQQCDKPG